MARVAFCFLLAFLAAHAELRRIDVQSQKDFGAYERVIGKAFFTADPKLGANKIVTDIALAPRNSDGLVEYSGDLVIYRPKQSRGTVFLEVVNRGTPSSLGILHNAQRSGLMPEQWSLGDEFLLKQGFTLAFLGWQFDVQAGAGLTFQAPTANVTGRVRMNRIDDGRGDRRIRIALQYCAADVAEPDAILTFRSTFGDSGESLPRAAWAFDSEGCELSFKEPTTRGPGLYEVVYTAKGSPIAGLGLAAIRDLASYFKFGEPAQKRVIGYGYSQSARFLRQYLRDGFNADEKGRAAFDGILLSSAGAGVGGFNHRFAYPGHAGNSVLSVHRPVDVPPFLDDGLLAAANRAKVTPYIFTTSTSTEYWARAASLIHTKDGASDAPLGPKSRMYLLTGAGHSRGLFPPSHSTRAVTFQHFTSFVEQSWVTRALIIDLDEWITSGKEPPPSAYPLLAKQQLVKRADVRFPQVKSMPFPDYMPQVWRADYGPDFASKGIIGYEPPRLGAAFNILVPQVDDNGNDLGGVPLPEIAVPLGTYTGWNIALPQLRDLNYLGGLFGSFQPFAKTRTEREQADDSRLSIAERYEDREAYLAKITAAADNLVSRRLLLAEDVPSVLNRAKRMWLEIVQKDHRTSR